MVNILQVHNDLRNDLRSNLQDPINRQGNWIHKGEINKSKTPAVFIDLSPSPRQEDITGGGKANFFNFDVHVVVGNKDQGIVKVDNIDTSITSSDDLRDLILAEIINRWDNIGPIGSYIESVNFALHNGNWRIDDFTKVATARFEVHVK